MSDVRPFSLAAYRRLTSSFEQWRMSSVTRSHPFLDDITSALTREFAAVHPSDLVERCVRQAFRCFHGARIEAYLPVLVHKLAREELARHASQTRQTQPADNG